jgi:hypothetical protein
MKARFTFMKYLVFVVALFFFLASANGQSNDALRDLHKSIDNPRLDDSLRVRAIFEWVTDNIVYDVPMYRRIIQGKDTYNQEAKDVLHNKKGVCEGYANLFADLCNKSGYKCEVITGYARGGVYNDRSQRGESHAWNAIQINKTWYLVDCTWAAGSVDERDRFHRQRNESYYLVAPSKMIADHYPFDPLWQLNQRPVSLEEYESNQKIGESGVWNLTDSLQQHFQRVPEKRESIVCSRVLNFDPSNGYFLADLGYGHQQDAQTILESHQNELQALRGTGNLLTDYDRQLNILQDAEYKLLQARRIYAGIKINQDDRLKDYRAEALTSVNSNLKYISDERKWLKKYFRNPGPIN